MSDKKRRGSKSKASRPRAPDQSTRLARYAAALAADPEHPDGDEALRLVDHLLDEGLVDRLDEALRIADELGLEAFERLRELIEHAATHVAVAEAGAEESAVFEARLYALVVVGPAAAIPEEIDPETVEALTTALQMRALIGEAGRASFAASMTGPVAADSLDWVAVAEFAAALFDDLTAGGEEAAALVHDGDPTEGKVVVRLLPFATIELPEAELALESADASDAEQAWLGDAAARLSEDFQSELDVIGVFPWFSALRMASITRRSLELGRILAAVETQHGRGPSALRARLTTTAVEEMGVAVRVGLEDAETGRRLVTADFPVLANEHVEDAWSSLAEAFISQGVDA